MMLIKLTCVVVFTVAAIALAGPTLSPPPGPVTESGRFGTRSMIPQLPHTITASGSYYLGANLTGIAGQHGLTIDADDVTIDLNGFALVGVPGSLEGIVVAGTHINLGIHNGTVRDWGQHGIMLDGGKNAVIEGVRMSGNGQSGIFADDTTVIRSCVSVSNGRDGIVGRTIVVVDCNVNDNTEDGIEVGIGSVVANCVATNSGFRGIASSSRTTIVGCSSSSNQHGIAVFPDSTVSGCTVSENSSGGIAVQERCTVRDCSSTGNGTFGIGVTGAGGARLDGNNVADNASGIDASASLGNLIIRNSAAGNGTNYNILPGNDVGPIGSAATSTSPWANISF